MNQQAWNDHMTQEISRLTQENTKYRRQLRDQRRSVDQWRRRYCLLQDQLRTLTRARRRAHK